MRILPSIAKQPFTTGGVKMDSRARIPKILIVVLMLPFFSRGQNIDSLTRLLEKEKVDTNRVWLLGELSYAYLYSKPDTALYLVQEGLKLSRKIDFEEGEAYSLVGIGNAFRITGNYPRALEAFLESLKIYEEKKDQQNISISLVNMGTVYTDLTDYKQALDYYFRALRSADAIRSEAGRALPLLNIGDSYEKLNRLDSARIYTQQAYEAAVRVKDEPLTGMALSNLGNIHLKMKQPALAMEYFRLSLPYFSKAQDDDGLIESSFGMAKVFRETGNTDSAVYYGKTSLQIAQRAGFTKRILDLSSFLVDMYKSRGQVDSAYNYIQLLLLTKDSLFNQEKVKEVQHMTFNENIRQQELEEARAQAELERKHNMQLMGIAAFIFFFILFVLLFISKRTSPRTIKFFGIIGLLLIFEFISLMIHPLIEKITHHTPVLMLLILVCIAAILVPLHHRLEHFINDRLVNKRVVRKSSLKKTLNDVGPDDVMI